jgi:hypothetical protein
LTTTWYYRLERELRITPDMIDDFAAFEQVMHATGLGRREGNSWIFGRVEDYQHVFLAYATNFGQVIG